MRQATLVSKPTKNRIHLRLPRIFFAGTSTDKKIFSPFDLDGAVVDERLTPKMRRLTSNEKVPFKSQNLKNFRLQVKFFHLFRKNFRLQWKKFHLHQYIRRRERYQTPQDGSYPNDGVANPQSSGIHDCSGGGLQIPPTTRPKISPPR